MPDKKVEYKLFRGKFRYSLISETQVLWKTFNCDELQNICAKLIEGYEKDGNPDDLWNELFMDPISYELKDHSLFVKLEIGEFTTEFNEDARIITKMLAKLEEINHKSILLEKQVEIYESILKEKNLLNKKFKPDYSTSGDIKTTLLLLDE